MFDIGWTELLVIGVVALIVIGPKDLPEMFRTLGRFTTKARSMARDFQRAMETAADEAGVKDVAKDLQAMTSPRSMGLDAVKSAAAKFEKWDPMQAAPKPAAPASVAVGPKAPAAMGPATQALADAQAAKRAASAAEPTILRPDPEVPAPASHAPRQPKVAAPDKPRAKARVKAAAVPPATDALPPTVGEKPARKPRKPAAGKTGA